MIITQAEHIASNVLQAYGIRNHAEIGHKIIREIVNEQKKKQDGRNPVIVKYLDFLNTNFNQVPIPYSAIVGKSRKREIVDCRHFIAYALYTIEKMSLNSAGEMLGGRDHSTVINSRNTVEDLCDVDSKWENTRTTMLAMFKKDENEIKL